MINTGWQKAICGCLLFWLCGSQVSAESAYTIEVIDRQLYGPGPFPDQKLKTAWLRDIQFDSFLKGKVKGFNNLGEEPNVSGEALQGKTVDGKMSDGTLINENIDMSNAIIMNGQFNLLLGAVYGGSNEGNTYFFLDEAYNWWIRDDIAIDPGFPAGMVKIDNFTFTTAPRIIPPSIQTQMGYPGGTNQTGSLQSGRVALGRLGDKNMDGMLDGIFNALGQFPMEAIFLPGAPFVQLFEFKSNIPITPMQAAMLNAASARSYSKILKEIQTADKKHPDIAIVQEQIKRAMQEIQAHLQKLLQANPSGCADCDLAKQLSAQIDAAKAMETAVIEQIYEKLVALHEQNNG